MDVGGGVGVGVGAAGAAAGDTRDQAGIHSNRQALPQRNWPTNRMSRFTEKLTAYDSAVALMGNKEIAFVMAAACKTGDAAYIVNSLCVVARAKDAH